MNIWENEALARKFWSKVEKTETCWNWRGLLSNGYGIITWKKRNYFTHRVGFVLSGRTIPPGLVLDHLCRNKRCVNPAHLEPVTIGENVMRGDTICARHKAKTHCPRGHEYSLDNTRLKRGRRYCIKCTQERLKLYLAYKSTLGKKYGPHRRVGRPPKQAVA